MKLSSRGFTLVELMIVIAIIGILAAALFPTMTNYLKRSRDAARISHGKDIATAMGGFYADRENYPVIATSGTSAGCVSGAAGFTGTNYFPKGVPTDPQSSNNNGCAQNGQYAVGSTGQTSGVPGFVIVALLENANGGNYGSGLSSLSQLTGVLAIDSSTLQSRMGPQNRGTTNINVLTN